MLKNTIAEVLIFALGSAAFSFFVVYVLGMWIHNLAQTSNLLECYNCGNDEVVQLYDGVCWDCIEP